MIRLFRSSIFTITFALSIFSMYLAYKGKYEAAMAGAGVAVSVATSKKNNENDSENSLESVQNEWYRQRCEELQNEMRSKERNIHWKEEKLLQLIERAESSRREDKEMMKEMSLLKRDLLIISQRIEQQDRIKELEAKIHELETTNERLSQKSLPESNLEIFEPMQSKEQEIIKLEDDNGEV